MSIETTLGKLYKATLSSIATIEAKLDAQVLDGTPYLLAIEKFHPDYGPEVMIYGHWPRHCTVTGQQADVKGWLNLHAVPDHLCGTISFSQESASTAVRDLTRLGFNARAMHWRDVLKARLTEQQAKLELWKAKAEQLGVTL